MFSRRHNILVRRKTFEFTDAKFSRKEIDEKKNEKKKQEEENGREENTMSISLSLEFVGAFLVLFCFCFVVVVFCCCFYRTFRQRRRNVLHVEQYETKKNTNDN